MSEPNVQEQTGNDAGNEPEIAVKPEPIPDDIPTLQDEEKPPESAQNAAEADLDPNLLVLVTGASSFVSQHCIKMLLEKGSRVRSTMRSIDEEKLKLVRGISPKAADESVLEIVEADLNGTQEQWDKAIDGCEWVFHVATPVPGKKVDAKAMVDTTVKGMEMIMKAAAKNSSVRKVVYTGDPFACVKVEGNVVELNPELWSDADDKLFKKNPYARSKIAAEKAAWKIHGELGEEDNKFDFIALLPGFILGPILDTKLRSSPEMISQLLLKQIPMMMRVDFPCIDVREIALAHIHAAQRQQVAGERILMYSEKLPQSKIAEYLSLEFKPQGYKPVSSVAPNWMTKVMSWFIADVAMFQWMVGKEMKVDNQPMKEILGISGERDIKTAVLASAYSCIEKGLVKKTEKYALNTEYYDGN